MFGRQHTERDGQEQDASSHEAPLKNLLAKGRHPARRLRRRPIAADKTPRVGKVIAAPAFEYYLVNKLYLCYLYVNMPIRLRAHD